MPAYLIAAVLELVVQKNEALYRSKRVTVPPWGLLWVPDPLVVCAGDVCRLADTSKLQDAEVVTRRGQGSCHSLSCAYAAWLTVIEHRPTGVVLVPQGPGRHHVYARGVDGSVYDPQNVGSREAVAAWH